MSAAELEALDGEEAGRLIELRNKGFNAAYGGRVSPQEQKRADDAVEQQTHRTLEVRAALQGARKAEAGVLTVPAVEQPQ